MILGHRRTIAPATRSTPLSLPIHDLRSRWYAGRLPLIEPSTSGGSVLSEKSRSSLFQNLSPIVGEEAVGEMLAHFPATGGEKPVTKDYLDVRAGELRSEISELRGELHGEIGGLRSELREGLAQLRAAHSESKRVMYWLPGSVAAICAAIAFITRLTV
jgi:hypothetical protein